MMNQLILNSLVFNWPNLFSLVVRDVPHLRYNCTIADAISFLSETKVEKVAVIDNQNRFIGFLTAVELLRISANNTSKTKPIEDLVRQPQLTIFEGDPVYSVFEMMLEQGISQAVIVNKEVHILGVLYLHDILKAIWKSFMQLNQFYSEVLEFVHNGVLVINSHGTTIFYNKSAEEILGFQADQTLGKSIREFFPNSQTYQVLMTGEAQIDCRLTFGEKTLNTNFTPIVLNGNILGAVAIFRDITELKAVSDKLTVTEKLKATLEAVVDNAFEGIVVIDDKERITIMNQFYLDLLGLKLNDVVGKHIQEVSPTSELPNTLKTGTVQLAEPWNIGDHYFMISRAPIKKNGKIIGAIGKILFKNMDAAKLFAKKVMRLEDDLEYYKEEVRKIHSSQYTFTDIIGGSEKITSAKTLAYSATKTTSTVLLMGESGTGKEVFAQAIHNAGLRKHGPFVKINCAAVPEQLLESELFGYVEGAFTGASKGGKLGKFEIANHGTIFLDEIGDMSFTMQAKLLRVIQEREFERVGGTQPIKVDVRIIAATNRDLHQMVLEQQFRLDLYYRLNVLSIELPPLRERPEDLEALISALIERLNQRLESSIEGVVPEVLENLKNYSWPGNVRELENVLERAMNISDEPFIYAEHLPTHMKKAMGCLNSTSEIKTLEKELLIAEKEIIINALRKAKGNKVHASQLLGIHRSALYKKLSKHNLLS